MKSRKFPESLSRQLLWFMARSNESDVELARNSGVDAGGISRFKRGQRSLNLTAADKLAAHLGLRLSRIADE